MSKIKKESGMIIEDVQEVDKKTPLKSAQEVAVQRAEDIQEPAPNSSMDLVTVAVNKGMDIEYIKELIALKNQDEDRQIAEQLRKAKILFDQDFAEMQKEFEPVKRTKKNDQYNSSYADISSMQRQYGPIISAHGFAYDFQDEFDENGSALSFFCLKKYGYVKRTPVPVPAYIPAKSSTGKDIMNPMQAIGTMMSYGHRYAMKAGLGVTEEDEDTDGNMMSFEDGMKYSDDIDQITSCQNKEQLDIVYKSLSDKYRTSKDRKGFNLISKECGKQEVIIRG